MRNFNHLVDGPAQQARYAEPRANASKPAWQIVYCDPKLQAWMFGTEVVEDVERIDCFIEMSRTLATVAQIVRALLID